jgi:hypothetical protein
MTPCNTGGDLLHATGSSRALSVLACVTVVFCAISVNFSWVQGWNNSDSIVPALISIEKYSPFYWSENRFGMLVPLLASPVRDYGWNLLVQSQLIVFSGIGILLILDSFAWAGAAGRTVRTSIAALSLLVFYKPVASVVLLLPGSPYFVSLFLLLAALHFLLQPGDGTLLRLIGGLALLGLALWVNVSNVVIGAVAVAAWPASLIVNLPRRAGALALVGVVAAALLYVSVHFPGSDFRELLPVSDWAASLRLLLANVTLTIRETVAFTTIAAAAVYQAFRFRKQAYSPAHAIVCGALCQIVVTAGSKWVAQNAHDARYIAGPMFIVLAASVLTLSRPVAAGFEKAAGSATATSVCCLSLVVIVTQTFGFPSKGEAINYIKKAMADIPGPPPEVSCTHIIGSYWYVWEKVFEERLRTGQRSLWPVSHRSDALRDQWTAIPIERRKYCGLCADAQIEYMRVQEGVGPLTKEAQYGDVCEFRERPR